jgi:hypothetical protein
VIKVLLVVVVLALIIYLVSTAIIRRGLSGPLGTALEARRRATGKGPGFIGRPAAKPRPQPRRPVAPDDDEDFLRELDRKRRSGDSE